MKYTVTGRCQFPEAQMRMDRARPASEADVALIEESKNEPPARKCWVERTICLDGPRPLDDDLVGDWLCWGWTAKAKS